MTADNQQHTNMPNINDAPPEPPAGYHSADDADWQAGEVEGNGEVDSWGYGADSADDAGDQENPWANAPLAGSNYRGGYEPNRRNPEAALGITTRMKVGWFVLGFFLGIFAPIIVYMLYQKREPEVRITAFRYVLIGLLVGALAELLLISTISAELAAFGPVATSGSEGWTSTNF